MSNKNEVFEYLIDQLRQQVGNDPYKKQCEDLAHEVLSLKNQLRDASALVAELHKEIDRLAAAAGDVEAFKRARKGAHIPEQSGCRKEDVQECSHDWHAETFYGVRVSPTYCRKCGMEVKQ